jgi:hypothetical protein
MHRDCDGIFLLFFDFAGFAFGAKSDELLGG